MIFLCLALLGLCIGISRFAVNKGVGIGAFKLGVIRPGERRCHAAPCGVGVERGGAVPLS